MVFPDGHHEEGTSGADREKLSTDPTKLQMRTKVTPKINVLSQSSLPEHMTSMKEHWKAVSW